jgi:hypothetical protein
MARDSVRRAVELHKLPEHAHLVASVKPDKTDHITSHEATRMAMEEKIREQAALAAQKLAARKKKKQPASARPK